jgi:endo-1,4-beta-xylanase
MLAAATAALMPGTAHAATQICSNQTGTESGFYYSLWENGTGSACLTYNGSAYSTSWSSIGDFTAGVGWNPGNTNTVNFTSSVSDSAGTALVSVYGWMTSPLVEYYVEENWSGSTNGSGTNLGTFTDGSSTYTLWEHQQVNQPCITGNSCTFEQYIAVRSSPTTSASVNMANVEAAWKAKGLSVGTMNYEIVGSEAWGGGTGSTTINGGASGSGGGNKVTVTNPGSQSGTVGTAVSRQISASDSGGASLAYSASGLPSGLSISSSGNITGTPTTAGTYNVSVTAKDSTGASGSTTFTWTIASSGGGGGGGGGSGTCSVSYSTTNSWAGGFTANVTIKNTGTSAISTWKAGWTYPGDQKLTSDYNGSYTQSGEAVTLTPASYNGSLAAGASTTVGVQGTWTSNDTAPTSFTCS